MKTWCDRRIDRAIEYAHIPTHSQTTQLLWWGWRNLHDPPDLLPRGDRSRCRGPGWLSESGGIVASQVPPRSWPRVLASGRTGEGERTWTDLEAWRWVPVRAGSRCFCWCRTPRRNPLLLPRARLFGDQHRRRPCSRREPSPSRSGHWWRRTIWWPLPGHSCSSAQSAPGVLARLWSTPTETKVLRTGYKKDTYKYTYKKKGHL